jgi:hypothetical protein
MSGLNLRRNRPNRCCDKGLAFLKTTQENKSLHSSVSIVGATDWLAAVAVSPKAIFAPLNSVHTPSGTHPASCTIDTVHSFAEV